ncbi:tRNA synthetases class I-domain-containing protein [Globomyces pollinis-pini]|nr:tRNA synthetases class I-domain-containing protein [Globomyces pollinis-pini]
MEANSNPDAPKTKNQEKNEAKRLAKLAKFNAKQAKKAEEAPKKAKAPSAKKEKPVAPKDPEYVNNTVKGEKKDLSHAFQSAFQPRAVEAAWYDWWEKQGYFEPELKPDGTPLDAGTYVVPMPPPNVTGKLHLGHAMTNSIQDVMVRWNRMKGKTVLYVPGCDHAGISVQVIVEKKLMRDRQMTRHALGRDNFIQECYTWKDEYMEAIYNQIRRLGTSADWKSAKFTMEPAMCQAVNEAFVRMYQDGTIYRANRLVNWCTKLKTALSNLEVENIELEGRTMLTVADHDPKKKYEFGVLISFAYRVENSDEKIVVATTRLETMLGDTAIAVHPSDKRYQHLHGKYVIHPFNGRRIIICADEYPDPEFGTGAVKITPAHDHNDFIVGKRQNVEFINIFTDDGKINEHGAPFTGLQRFDARVAVLEALKEKGLYVGTEDNKMVLPMCARSGNIVEPLLKPQWWVNTASMCEDAINAVKSGELEIVPAISEKEWFRWLESPQDWCISRQLWWGHRVPAYFVCFKGDENNRDDSERWVVGRNDAEARENALKKYPNIPPEDITLEQDEDVLDTWFSSGLWPFATVGWPGQSQTFDNFFPASLLETGLDILFFWVARMVMMSQKLTGKIPFKKVYCHAMIRDAHGRKMSKSIGNVVDPLDVIEGISLENLLLRLEKGNLDQSELVRARAGQAKDFPNGIPECGTDALRFGLLAYPTLNRDINLDILRIDGYRKFCNKLWNATKFALMKLDDKFVPSKEIELTGHESGADLWILHKLNKAVVDLNNNIEQMNFMQATSAVYQFWWAEFCDVYLEACKPIIDGDDLDAKHAAQNVLYTCLDQGLKLLHPFMPFVTEELYQRLPRRPLDKIPSIMKTSYPVYQSIWDNAAAESNFEFVNSVVHASRSLLTDYNLKSNATIYVQTPDKTEVVRAQAKIAKSLIKGCAQFNVLEPDAPTPLGCSLYTLEDTKIFLLVKGMVDIDAELTKLEKKHEKIMGLHDAIKKKQAAEGYTANVNEEIKALDINKLKGYQAEMDAITATMATFFKLSRE